MVSSKQMILPIESTDSYDVDDYIVTTSNMLAFENIKNWERYWGVSPYPKALLLEGGRSSGKTYLSKIWENLSNAHFIDVVDNFSSLPFTKGNCFILENIDTLDENMVLECFNWIHENEKYVLLTTSSTNHFLCQDLESRINAVAKIRILEPDDALMQMLLFKYFSTNCIAISKQAFNFLLHQLPRRFDQINHALAIINGMALEHKRHVTVNLIKEAMQL